MMEELSKWYENLTYTEAKDILREKMDNLKMSFIAAGYYLKYIRDHELFREDGYESIWEFAEDNYGIKKSTASRWMSMNDKFSKDGNSPVLAAEFRGFEKSQLQEMLYLDDKQLQEVKPGMTVKEIREVRRPEEPEKEERRLKKPDAHDEEYLNQAARHLIISKHDWFLKDFENRVIQVDKSPGELKEHLGKNRRIWWFSTKKGAANINLFDDCVQLWDEKYEHIGDFDWFYFAAALQRMWNVVTLERIQEEGKAEDDNQENTNPIDRGCITGQSPNGNCVCCGNKGAECCGQCEEECNSRCGWIESAVATSQQENQEPEETSDAPPIVEKASADPEEDVIDTTATEINLPEGVELSNKSDMQILDEILLKEKSYLSQALECYDKNDIHIRRQKIKVEALEGMKRNLETMNSEEPEQPTLPALKNNDQRKGWLGNYQNWGLWYEDEHIGARFYKYDFDNGARLIAEEYTRPATRWCGELVTAYMHLIGGPEPTKAGDVQKWIRNEIYNRHPNSETELVEFLKYVQKEGK